MIARYAIYEMSPAASSAPNHGGGDEGRSAYKTPSGEEMAPASTGARTGAANFPRSSAAHNERSELARHKIK